MSQCQLYKERRKELEKFYHEYGELFRVTLPDETGVLSLPSETLKDIQEKGEKLKKKIKELYRKFDIYEYAWKKFTEGENVKLKEVLEISENTVKEGQWHSGEVYSHSFTDKNFPLGAGLLVTGDTHGFLKFTDISDPDNIRIVRTISADSFKEGGWHSGGINSQSFTDKSHPLDPGLLVTTGADETVKFADVSDPDNIRVVQTIWRDTVKEEQWHSGEVYSHSFTDENSPLDPGLLVTTGEEGSVRIHRPEIDEDND